MRVLYDPTTAIHNPQDSNQRDAEGNVRRTFHLDPAYDDLEILLKTWLSVLKRPSRPHLRQQPLRPRYRIPSAHLPLNTDKNPQESMRDQSTAIREQVSFKQREEHIRESWNFLCSHYHLNKSDLVKFLIKKEEYFLRKPETIPAGFIKDWL